MIPLFLIFVMRIEFFRLGDKFFRPKINISNIDIGKRSFKEYIYWIAKIVQAKIISWKEDSYTVEFEGKTFTVFYRIL